MFGRKKQSISKKYILILIIILIILLLIIFSFTLKEDRKLSKAESLLKDGLTYSEKIIKYGHFLKLFLILIYQLTL